ncbi:MAG: putative zinc-binding metallopeptidase [Mariniblastus sp.]
MPAATRKKRRTSKTPPWAGLKDEQLLDLRICDLNLEFEDTKLVEYRDQLHKELAQRDLKIKPHCWFSDDWFAPDGIPGIAFPFYMAHPRLMRLERSQMLEVEGGTKSWCMRILRHEAGHAVDTAFRLHRRKKYKSVFGNYSDPYPEYYRPKPRSKNFVLHLEPWYAQSHPSEDFAETFAVWLKPRSKWRKEYEGWKVAFKKIQLVEELMDGLADKPPAVKSRKKVDPAHRNKKTLREHYDERRSRYSIDSPSVFDDDLRKMFPQTPKSRRSKTAAAFLKKNRDVFSQSIAQWTGEYQYNINQVLREMIDRCRVLKLYVDGDETELRQNLSIMLTVHTMNYLHGAHRVAL